MVAALKTYCSCCLVHLSSTQTAIEWVYTKNHSIKNRFFFPMVFLQWIVESATLLLLFGYLSLKRNLFRDVNSFSNLNHSKLYRPNHPSHWWCTLEYFEIELWFGMSGDWFFFIREKYGTWNKIIILKIEKAAGKSLLSGYCGEIFFAVLDNIYKKVDIIHPKYWSVHFSKYHKILFD